MQVHFFCWMKFRFTWCRTCGTSGKFGFGCTTEPEERREKAKSQRQHKWRTFASWYFSAAIKKLFIMPDLGSHRVCPAGSLHCPAGWSSGASGRARMETGHTVRLYCAPITESLGSHLQTGLGGLTLWRQDRNTQIQSSTESNNKSSVGNKFQTGLILRQTTDSNCCTWLPLSPWMGV